MTARRTDVSDLRDLNDDQDRVIQNVEPDDKPTLLFVERPRCPDCGCVRLLAYKTTKAGDDSITRRCKCADCGRKIHLVLE